MPISAVATPITSAAVSLPTTPFFSLLGLSEHSFVLLQKLRARGVKARITAAISNPVPVWIAIGSSLETRHAEEGHRARGSENCRHDHSHVQLGTQSMHIHNQIGRVANEAVPLSIGGIVYLLQHRRDLILGTPLARTESLHLHIEIVTMVQSPPRCGDASLSATAQVILHGLVLT